MGSEQEKINKWLEKYTKMLDDQKNKSQVIISSLDYLNWLKAFTIEHPSFTDDDWLYFCDDISSDDYKQVTNLHLLFIGIESYAKNNYIYPIDCDFGNFYRIKCDNVGFEIGILAGQGTINFCRRVSVRDDENFIDFYDIINKKDVQDTNVKNKLQQLSDLIIFLYEDGIPLKDIEFTINDVLTEINSQNNQPMLLEKTKK